jgi:DNA polymerase-3 subunit gamma/tau
MSPKEEAEMQNGVWYNKYRPRRFSDVLGQEGVSILKHQASTGKFAHSYLLYGASGSGKTTVARILAMALNCDHNGTGEPCGECQNCKAIIQCRHWDVLEIDGAQCTGIDYIRDLKFKAYLCPLSSRKVYIIDEAHRLSEQAWDGLLKLLEEPPPHLVVILCSTQAEKIPITVKSRCQLYPFQPLKADEIRAKLKQIAQAEGISSLSPQSLEFIVQTACGNMRSAINLLEQVCVG